MSCDVKVVLPGANGGARNLAWVWIRMDQF